MPNSWGRAAEEKLLDGEVTAPTYLPLRNSKKPVGDGPVGPAAPAKAVRRDEDRRLCQQCRGYDGTPPGRGAETAGGAADQDLARRCARHPRAPRDRRTGRAG